MDGSRFDDLIKNLVPGRSRRGFLIGLGKAAIGAIGVGGPVGAVIWSRGGEAAACRSIEQTCTSNGQCCSGTCGSADNRGRRTCVCPANAIECDRDCCGGGTICVRGQCLSGTPTATSTPSTTPTMTATATASNTPTDTATATASYTPTDTPTSTTTPTATETPTDTATPTVTDTPTNTATATATNTPGPGCGEGGACIVFVTSTEHKANLGGIAGADLICNQRAAAAELPGVYEAWLSDSSTSPGVRFYQSPNGYKLVDGTLIASSWGDLIDGTLATPINKDETGAAVSGQAWTTTDPDGSRTNDNTCEDWTNEFGGPVSGQGGSTNSTDREWTIQFGSICTSSYRLYCFEQSQGE